MEKKFYQKSIYGIQVVAPSEEEVRAIIKAAKFLKKHGGKNFKHFLKMKAVLIYPKNAYDNELFPDKKIWVTEERTIQEAETDWIAALLLHEAYHLKQYYDDGEREVNSRLEKAAYLVQRKFLLSVKNKPAVSWLDKQFKEKWWLAEGYHKNGDGYRSPSTRRFKRFVNKYLSDNLNIKQL